MPISVGLILSRLHDENEKPAFIVGGCVRDALLGNQPHDWDICTSATPDEMLEIFDDCRAIETGLKHGTATLIIRGEQFEVTTFRKDGDYSDGRHPDRVEYVSDIETDLSRRDFTMNAMAWNEYSGLIDPFGGRLDLEKKLIRCVGDPDKRFQEDGLRILRALRFASVLGFDIDAATREAIHRNKELLTHISAERIHTELQKMLLGRNILRILLDFADVFATIIPQLQPCIGFEQNNPYHQYTVYEHIARSVAAYTGSDVVVKLALLLHDIGKPLCYSCDERGGHFYGHAAVSKKIAKEVMENLKFDNETADRVVELVELHDAAFVPTIRAARRWLNGIGEEQAFRLIEVRKADVYGQREDFFDERMQRAETLKSMMKEVLAAADCFTLKDLAVHGNDIMQLGISQGKQVGIILKRLLDRVIDEDLPNERETLLLAAHKIKGELDEKEKAECSYVSNGKTCI